MAYKSAKKSAALSLKFLFWFLNLKVCYVSVIIVLVTHANLLVALPRKTILDMRQFCWQTSKLIEMDTKTMHAGSHREDKNQWRVKIKTHLNLHEKTAGWRIQLQMTSCVVCPIWTYLHDQKVQWENKIEKQTPVHSEIKKEPDQGPKCT